MKKNKRPGLFLTALGLACFAFLQPAGWSTTAYGRPLFVITTLSNSFAVINSAINQVTTTIAVGRSPIRLPLTEDGLKAYVSNTGSNTVSVIDTLNRIVTGPIPTGHSGPQEITVTPDGGCGPRLKYFSL
ncbi:MAG: YncE family protein [Candidatus Udaeobacter sp.]